MRPSFSVSIAILYPLPTSPITLAFRHAAVVQDQLASGGRADAQLVLLLADLQARELALDQESRDALVSGLLDSTLANTRNKPASAALVIQSLRPVSR